MKNLIIILIFTLPFHYANSAVDFLIDYNDSSYSQEFKETHKDAINNSAEAQQLIGSWYLGGMSVQKNTELGIFWLKRSAKNGNGEAKYLLGQIYEEGKNFSLARSFYESVLESKNLNPTTYRAARSRYMALWKWHIVPISEELPDQINIEKTNLKKDPTEKFSTKKEDPYILASSVEITNEQTKQKSYMYSAIDLKSIKKIKGGIYTMNVRSALTNDPTIVDCNKLSSQLMLNEDINKEMALLAKSPKEISKDNVIVQTVCGLKNILN